MREPDSASFVRERIRLFTNARLSGLARVLLAWVEHSSSKPGNDHCSAVCQDIGYLVVVA